MFPRTLSEPDQDGPQQCDQQPNSDLHRPSLTCIVSMFQCLFPRRLSKPDQERVFPNSVTFDSPADQEAFVREWAQKRTGLACSFKVRFYPGRYAPEKGGWQPPVCTWLDDESTQRRRYLPAASTWRSTAIIDYNARAKCCFFCFCAWRMLHRASCLWPTSSSTSESHTSASLNQVV